jgi:hypothetical protein
VVERPSCVIPLEKEKAGQRPALERQWIPDEAV